MSEALSFQDIMMTLQRFWAEKGCLIWQPYYTQVGAGTMNPATALRVLGPEPWNVAYVEPSVRPDDGRYGENPNRMQMHYQFQVILKPDPGKPQEIYLQSLSALGIDPRLHDIRFVEDNWESPALGAWGLGWEVWLDGQEITQFTYFQQAGGQILDPVSVEITYGLERIAIALQRVNSFRDIRWNANFTDGDVNLQAEQEHSQYYFEIADVGRLRQMYDLFESEANICLEHGLVLPAHDYILKCSHTFNVLDTRGAIGVTERQALFSRMRDLSRRVASAYVEKRQQLEFPWLNRPSLRNVSLTGSPNSKTLPNLSFPTSPAPFLLEIGTEEIPVAELDSIIDQLKQRLPQWLSELRLSTGKINVWGTPRRLVLYVEELAPAQADSETVVKGPPAAKAFLSDGTPTPAAEGFARSKGFSTNELQIRKIDGGEYVCLVIRQKGKTADQGLSEALPDLIAGLHFEKSMRWNTSNTPFVRPIRWLLALYGNQQIAFTYASILSDRITRGWRFMEPEETSVQAVPDYFDFLAQQGIILDPQERRRNIWEQVETQAKKAGGEVLEDRSLLDEVTNLVEAPTALLGRFDPTYLELPPEVLISVMKKHQRYFPVSKKGQLLPYFITIVNKPASEDDNCEGSETILEGNQHVIRARFADAAYFVHEDLKQPLENYLPKLNDLVFQQKLGSMLDKTQRLEKFIESVGKWCHLDENELRVARRAAHLCKADLATKMVVEMTSLQGLMGKYYALARGESPEVAEAIGEHYLPRFAGDTSPKTRPGLAVGVADRLDTLTGLFAAGLAPSGNKDPFALRRAGLGLVQNLVSWDMDFNLRLAIQTAAQYQPISATEENLFACRNFIIERLRNWLQDRGYRYDVVDAVLVEQGDNPATASRAVGELSNWVNRSDWRTILPAYARCVRITRDLTERYPVLEERFNTPAEKNLYAALLQAETQPRRPGSVDDFLNAFLPMIPRVTRFFDEVLVMAEDGELRQNRLGLLQRICSLAEGVADMSRLEGF